MKKLGILLLLFALVSCDNVDSVDRSDVETQKEKEKRVETKIEGKERVETSDGFSYWFVVVQRKGAGNTKMNIIVKQNHSYFSAKELKAEFKHGVFILNLVEISKETYEHNK